MSARFAWIGRILRGRRLDRNPLRRGSDRVETVILAALLAAFLGAAPFAAGASASWIGASSQRELVAQHANFRQVTAVLLEAAWAPMGYGVSLSPEADARWVAPDGAVKSGMITVPADAKAGAKVKIWTDLSGQLVTPLKPEQVALRADLAAAAAVAALGTALLITVAVVRQALNRRRIAAWEADWRATGPRWTSRAGPPADT
ncbi:MAG TPA: hypothetical protein VFB06_09090 [Streptosporangiaceae bacterium]|nr:hypothetical protein [Streptosporangiaceae bacterium]